MGGPLNGSAPAKVAKVLRSFELKTVLYPEIEQQLLKVQLSDPRGDWDTNKENDRKWKEALNLYLIDYDTMYDINGGRWRCSELCLDQEYNEYQFVDTARFALANCVHSSFHLQCIASSFIDGEVLGYSFCPIRDTPQCKYDNANRGFAYFWAPQDYSNFAKAFFRTKALTEVFLKPEYR